MRGILSLVATLVFGAAYVAQADTDVTLTAAGVSIHATNASIPQILDVVRAKTGMGMRVIYDGPPPAQLLKLAVVDQTPVSAVVRLLEGRGIKYAMVLNALGTQIDVLLISTAPAPPRRAEMPRAPMSDAGDMSEDQGPASIPEGNYEPAPPMMPAGAPTAVPAPPAVWGQASGAQPPAVSPFTPQGPGPIILQQPGATPPPPTPAPIMTPLPGPSTAEQAPWERGIGY